MNLSGLWRNMTLVGLWGLIALILIWNLLLSHVQYMPVWVELIAFLTPLFLLMKGILQGNTKVLVYAVMFSLVYMIVGVWEYFDVTERPYAIAMIILSACLYIGSFMSAKLLGKRA